MITPSREQRHLVLSFTVVVVQLFSRVRLFATPWTVALQAPLSVGFPTQKYWSGLPFPFPEGLLHPGIPQGSNPCLRPPRKSLFTIPLEDLDSQPCQFRFLNLVVQDLISLGQGIKSVGRSSSQTYVAKRREDMPKTVHLTLLLWHMLYKTLVC